MWPYLETVFEEVIQFSSVAQSCLTLCDPIDSEDPARLFCPWGFLRQEYWSALPCLPPGIFPTQGLNPSLLYCRQTLYHLSHEGSPLEKMLKGKNWDKWTLKCWFHRFLMGHEHQSQSAMKTWRGVKHKQSRSPTNPRTEKCHWPPTARPWSQICLQLCSFWSPCGHLAPVLLMWWVIFSIPTLHNFQGVVTFVTTPS